LTVPVLAQKVDFALADDIARFEFDPLGYVKYVFDWGHGELKSEIGPDDWQADTLNQIGEAMRGADTAVQIAIASGHGIGKTTISAWIIHWFCATRPGCAGVVTANTRDQLVNKTWRELSKWNARAINGHWFDWSATAFRGKEAPATWFIAAQPWTKERSEAFAGLHEKDVLVLFDEASAIDDIIWEVSEGAMTEPGALWVAFGNPTRNTGRFRECFGKNKHRWIHRQIDSRTTKRASKAKIQQWIDDYGEDHDFVRVRVKGEFPRAGSMQLIPSDVVDEARKRVCEALTNEAVVLGVDVARYGDDQSVIAIRQGRDAKSRKWRRYRGVSTMNLASEVAMVAQMYRADAIFVDGTGIGAGVVDRLEQLKLPHGCSVYEINFGGKADATWVGDDSHMANKSAEMWWNMANWLKRGAIPDEQEIEDDLIGRQYGYNRDNAITLEKKDDMKERGLSSPDNADALALTFAYAIAPRVAEMEEEERQSARRARSRHGSTGY
jgi:hypothetical protein